MHRKNNGSLVVAKLLPKIPYCVGPLHAKSTISYLTHQEYKDKFGGCEYTESVYGNKDTLKDYLHSQKIAELMKSRCVKQPDIAALRHRLENPHDGLVICKLDEPFNHCLFSSREIKAGEIIFLYSGDIETPSANENNIYSLQWLPSEFNANKVIAAQKRGGLSRFLAHLPEDFIKSRAQLKKEIEEVYGQSIHSQIKIQGSTLDEWIKQLSSDLENSDYHNELKSLVYLNPTYNGIIQTANMTTVGCVLNGIPLTFIMAKETIPAYTHLGYSYGKAYLEVIIPRYLSNNNCLIPKSSHFDKKLGLDKALSANPNMFTQGILPYYQKAVDCYKDKHFQEAQVILTNCIMHLWNEGKNSDEMLVSIYSTLASVYRDIKEYEEAIECCKQALALAYEVKAKNLPAVQEKMRGCLTLGMPNKTRLHESAVQEHNCKRFPVAIALLEHLLAKVEIYQPTEDEKAYYYSILASAYRDMHEYNNAFNHATSAYQIRYKLYGELHQLTISAKSKLDQISKFVVDAEVVDKSAAEMRKGNFLHARESKIPLSNFVQRYKGNVAGAESLVETFLAGQVPPAQHFPLATTHIAQAYVDRQSEASTVGALGAYLLYSLIQAFPDGFPNWQSDEAERRQMLEVFLRLYGTIPTDIKSNAQIVLFSKAAFYEFTQIGSCSYRASYAALALFKIFQDTSLNVSLQSAPSVDQYTVLIGNKKEGFYVYDALTNPLMVYDRDFYIKNILSTFTSVKHQAVPMNITITKKLSEIYDRQSPVIKKEFIKLLESSEKDANRLLIENQLFVISLELNKIPRKQMLPHTEKAIKYAQTLVEKASLTLKK